MHHFYTFSDQTNNRLRKEKRRVLELCCKYNDLYYQRGLYLVHRSIDHGPYYDIDRCVIIKAKLYGITQ